MDHPVFANQKFTEREAWIWLIENAAFKPRTFRIGKHVIPLGRGQLATTMRFLADAWQWSKSHVARFLDKLKTGTAGEPMIETACGTEHTIITICNYDQYQAGIENVERGAERELERDAGHERDTGGTKQKELKELSYKYTGRVIRLTAADYDRWKRAYSAIPDFDAELARVDDALGGKLKPGEQWFPAASAMLAAKHQKLLGERKKPAPSAAASAALTTDDEWRRRLKRFNETGFWSPMWGSNPRFGGEDVPKHLMAEWKAQQGGQAA